MQQMRAVLDGETRNLNSATDDNIRLKASLEQLSSKLASVESRVREPVAVLVFDPLLGVIAFVSVSLCCACVYVCICM